MPMFVLSHLPKSSIKSSSLSLTNSGGSSSAGPALVEIATARSFILNRGIVTDIMSATPLEPGCCVVLTTALVECSLVPRPSPAPFS